jgi:hypothetical protein
MILECKNCGKEFQRDRKPKTNAYCSTDCSHAARITKVKCNCGYCGKELLKSPAEIKKSKSGFMFCNKSCACSYNNTAIRSGENNPNWKDGTYKTQNYSKVAFRNYQHKCSICGFDEPSCLEVHHIDKDRTNDNLNNLIILCANHHNMIHYGNFEITEEIKQNRELQ